MKTYLKNLALALCFCAPLATPLAAQSPLSGYTKITPNYQTGTSFTFVTGNAASLVSFANASAIAGTLGQAGTASFPAGWYMDVQNTGAGTLTITPTTSTIDGAATLVLTTGCGGRIISDGTNWASVHSCGGSGGGTSVGTLYTEAGASCGAVTTCTYTGFTLAANTITATGVGSCLVVMAGFANSTNNNSWTTTLKIGGSTVGVATAGVSQSSPAPLTAYVTQYKICNTGTRTANVMSTYLPSSGNSITLMSVTTAVDFTASNTVDVVFNSGSTSDTIVRHALFVYQQ